MANSNSASTLGEPYDERKEAAQIVEIALLLLVKLCGDMSPVDTADGASSYADANLLVNYDGYMIHVAFRPERDWRGQLLALLGQAVGMVFDDDGRDSSATTSEPGQTPSANEPVCPRLPSFPVGLLRRLSHNCNGSPGVRVGASCLILASMNLSQSGGRAV